MPNCRVEVRILPLQQLKKQPFGCFFRIKDKFGILPSYYFSMVPKSADQDKPKRSASRKKRLRLLRIGLLALLALEFSLYFGSNLFLGNLVRRKLQTTFNGVYALEFNRVHLSLLRRGIFLDGIVMKPINQEKAKANQPLFELTLDEIAFSGLWIWNQELHVREISLDRLNFHFLTSSFGSDSPHAIAGQSEVVLLEKELKKSLANLPFSGVKVRNMKIEHAQIFYLNFSSQPELLAKNASFKVLDMHWLPNQVWNTPFNARGFEFELEEVTFYLPDRIHRITSKNVLLSSLEGTIDLQEIKLAPDLSQPSSTYYSLDLEGLHVQHVNLNQAFRTSRLELEELVLNSPKIKVIQSSSTINSGSKVRDLSAFIREKLNQISIKELSIREASFLRKEKEDSLRNRIQLEQLDLNMVDFYLGGDSLRNQKHFFYGSDASLTIGLVELFMGDGIHVLKGQNFKASTFKNELTGTNLQLTPREMGRSQSATTTNYEMNLAQFTFDNVDLKKWYSQGDLDIETLVLRKPQLSIRETNTPVSNAQIVSSMALLSGLVNQLAIQSFQIEEGALIWKEESGVKSTDLDLGKFSLELEKFRLQSNSSLPFQEQFQFDEMLLTLYDYRLKLRDNLHEFLAQELTIDSRKELIAIEKLRIHPAKPVQVRKQLEALGKTSAVNFSIPYFRAYGIGLKEALFDQELHLNHLQMEEPTFYWETYRTKESKASENAMRSADDLKALLLGYFEEIQMDSVTISDAKVRYENKVKEAVTRFEEDQLNFKLKNFTLQKNVPIQENRALFSDEANLTFNSYTFSLAEGKYIVDTDYLNYNSRTQTLDFKNLRLLPGKVGEQHLALGFNFPKVALRGVNVEEFIFDNVLNLEKLDIDGGEIALGVDRQVRASNKSDLRTRNLALKRAVQQVHIDTISTSNATLLLNFIAKDQSKKALKTGFGFQITQFDLDSLGVRTQDLSKTYQDVNLGLSNFEFALPDSVHTLKFEAFGFGGNQDELVFSGFSIHPKNQMGKKGMPVMDGKIERVILKKNSVLDMLTSKKVDLSEVRIQKPNFSFYLDSLTSSFASRLGSFKKLPDGVIQEILVGDLILENGRFDFYSKGGVALSNLSFPKIDVRLEQLGIDLLKVESFPTWKELLTKTKSLSLENYQAYVQDSSYLLQVDSLWYLDQKFQVSGIHYAPVLGVYGYLNSLSNQGEAVKVQVKKLEIPGIEINKLTEAGIYKGEFLKIDGASFTLFRDKRKLIDPLIYKPLPQYLMEHSPINLNLASLQFKNSNLQYWEFGEKSTLPGSITFHNIQLDASPFYLRKKGEPYPVTSFRLGVSGQVGDSSQLNLTSQLFFEKGYPMDVEVNLAGFAFAEVKDLLSKTAFVRPIGGGVTQGSWKFRLDEEKAVGTMSLGYSDLKFQFLDSLTLGPGKGKLKFYTLLANLWANNSNPRVGSNSLRKTEIYRLRDPQRSVVNAWWKATYVGLKGAIGFGKAKTPKNLRKEDEN